MATLQRLATFLTLLVVPCTGCGLPTFVHPLAPQSESEIDARLIGTWSGDSDVSREWTIVRGSNTRNALELELSDGPTFLLYKTNLGGHDYLSVGVPPSTTRSPVDWTKTKPVGYLIVRYDFRSPDEVEVRLMRNEPIAEAIAGLKLSGTVKTQASESADGRYYNEVSVVDTSANVQRFLEANSAKCFSAHGEVLKRVRGEGD